MKNRIAKSLTCAMLALSLVSATVPGWAQRMYSDLSMEDKGANMLLDVAIVRPLELATSIVGIGIWVIALPFTIPSDIIGRSDSTRQSGVQFVGNPLEYTFARPLGEWHFCGADMHPC
jgi:hypothetical protein